jgi:hypothetical protein
MIKLVWVGFVCCGIANGVIFSETASPEKYFYMAVVLLICFVFVGIHRHFTKHLVDENRDYDEDHRPIFLASAVAAVIVALIALIAGAIALSVGLLTAGVGFTLVIPRESNYA